MKRSPEKTTPSTKMMRSHAAVDGATAPHPAFIHAHFEEHDGDADEDMTEREDDEHTDTSTSNNGLNSIMHHSALHREESLTSLADDSASAGESEHGSDGAMSWNSSSPSAQGSSSSRKATASSYSNHRDLSARLRRAISITDTSFDESMIGADVVLCTRYDGSAFGSSSAQESTQAPEITRFYAHRFMLAASSDPFRAMLTGSMRESAQKEVEIVGVAPTVLERMLRFIYTGEVTIDLETVVGLLVAAEMYELVGLRESCMNFVLVHAHEVFRDPQFVQLPEKVLIELVKHDHLQIREMTLLEALVAWGEARVAPSSPPIADILSDLMEHVRFPTMSVSDLYSKVWPLAKNGVIRERLVTEASFFHHKWGSKTGERMKPRAGTAALRKRKRVSFIQHVSFTE